MNMQVRPPLMPMSAEQRSRLRRAIVQHVGWKLYRDNRGLSMDKMTAELLWAAALDLGIDPVAAINEEMGAAMEEHHKPRPFDMAQSNSLSDRFWKVRHGMPEKEQNLCVSILATIFKKQDGRATEKQFYTILNIIERTERPKESQGRAHSGNGSNGIETPKAAPEASKEVLRPALPSSREELLRELLKPQIDEAQLAAMVDDRIAKVLEGIPTVRIEVARSDRETKALDGHHHPLFPRLLKMAVSRGVDGFVPNIWLAGPAGSGKTHAAKMVAKALSLPWHYNGALSMPHELLGFIDAGGTYHRTPFREAYEHGGVYLFDEVDGSDNSALLALNAALANGTATFPDGQVQRHADCIIIATANTWGLGATADYVGRSKIDAAFLSRFPGRLPWDYDSALEVAISGNEGFARRVIAARERARTAGLKVLIDPRASAAGSAYIANGFTSDEAAEMTYLANLTKEQRKQVEGL